MELLARFWRVCRAQVSHWLDNAEDPSHNLDLALHEADDKYRDAREKVVMALTTKKRLERSIRASAEQADRKREDARAAVKAGNAAGARRALEQCRKLMLAADADGRALLRVTADVQGLQAALSRLEERISDADRRRLELMGQLKVGEAKMSVASATEHVTGLEAKRLGSAEAQLAELADQLNSEGEARMEMAESGSDLDLLAAELAFLDNKFAQLPARAGGGK